MRLSRGIGPARLLLVDDDALLRGIATKTLQHAGFEVIAAASGEAGLARFEAHPVDLVLLDLVMPDLDGYEVCRRIRALPHGARVPILILTGLDDTASIELAYSHGATDFITKPLNWTLLSHRVRYALRASASAEEMRYGRERLRRAQKLAGMGDWAIAPDGRIDASDELAVLFAAPDDRDPVRDAEGFVDRVVESDRAAVHAARSLLAREGKAYQIEFAVVRFDGVRRTMFEQGAVVPHDDGPSTYEGITQDTTERAQDAERIRRLAHYDPVTGLPNRQFFTELAVPLLERAARNGLRCVLLQLDLDHFKGVNDAIGREAGDTVLKTIAERLRVCVRGADLAGAGDASTEPGMLARVGGNAFTLLITDLVAPTQVATVVERLFAAVARPIVVGSQAVVLTASIGSASFPDDARAVTQLLQCSEQAVHAAKAAGRAQHRFFDEQLNVRAASRLRLEADLRRAIADDDLLLHFQPKVDAVRGVIVGAEALVRWQHAERGLVLPIDFIPLAEESGLILPLTDWVLEAGCRKVREWADAGLPSVPLSINLAALSLSDGSFVDRLDALMERFGLTPASLTLEMTETMLMRDVESAVVLLERLCTRGYGLSLDDFGTGHSSLSYLRRFPVHELKIDRAFVVDVERVARDGALVGAIIALGRELGLQVVAEGVETREQSAFLLQRGCNIQQGYLFSRPVSADAYAALLQGMHAPDGPWIAEPAAIGR